MFTVYSAELAEYPNYIFRDGKVENWTTIQEDRIHYKILIKDNDVFLFWENIIKYAITFFYIIFKVRLD